MKSFTAIALLAGLAAANTNADDTNKIFNTDD
jgi:hypothetical protein